MVQYNFPENICPDGLLVRERFVVSQNKSTPLQINGFPLPLIADTFNTSKRPADVPTNTSVRQTRGYHLSAILTICYLVLYQIRSSEEQAKALRGC